MSSNGAPHAPLVLTLDGRHALYDNACASLATAVITAHFWTVTFEQEVKVFWMGRVTGATVMFLLNRYIGLTYNLLNVIQRVATIPDQSCAVLLPTVAISLQLLYMIYGAFTSLRVFAVSKRSWSLALVSFGLCMAPIILSLLQDRHAPGMSAGPGLGCIGILNKTETFFSAKYELSSLALTMLSVLIADGLLIHQTWVAIAPVGSGNLGRRSLLQVLYRNEIRYFAVIIGIRIFAFGLTMVEFTTGRPDATEANDICDAITSLLVSQFLLELQAADRRIRAGGSQLSISNSRISSVVFHRVVGSIRHASLAPEDGRRAASSGESLFEDLAEDFAEDEPHEDHDKVVPDARECCSPTQFDGGGAVDYPSTVPLSTNMVHEV